MFFESWQGLERVLISGALSYVFLIAWLRISGKRTLSKWNAFDFVVTIALGSILASIITSKDTAIVEGVLAFAVLIVLQFVITWLSVRLRTVERVVKASPVLLLRSGKFLDGKMREERVTRAEILAAIRAAGGSSVESVAAVVLETDGSFSVVLDDRDGLSALDDVVGIK